MEDNKEPKKEEVKVIDPLVNMIIPICCREGWDSCTHVVQKPKKQKIQIAL